MGASLLPTSGRGSPSLLIWNASQARDFGPVTAAVLASEGLYARGASSSVSCLRSPPVTVRPSLASAHTPVPSPGGILFTPRLGKELCSPLLWPLGDTQAAGAVASGWRSGRPVWCWETDWQPGPEFPIVTWPCWVRSGWWRWLHTAPSLARGAGPRRGLGRSEPALSPRRPPPREKWKRNRACPERNRGGCFTMCPLRAWLPGLLAKYPSALLSFFSSA